MFSLKDRLPDLLLSVNLRAGWISINQISCFNSDDGSMIIVATSNNKVIRINKCEVDYLFFIANISFDSVYISCGEENFKASGKSHSL